MGAELLLQTLAAPLGAALLSWRWPRLGYLWGALALWLVGSWLGGAYGMPEKAWQWLPLTLLVPAIAAQVNDLRGSLLLFAVFSALVWWQGLASVLASEPGIWLALLPAILWFGWSTLRCDSREGLGFALGFIWLALVIGIDGSLLIAQLGRCAGRFRRFSRPARHVRGYQGGARRTGAGPRLRPDAGLAVCGGAAAGVATGLVATAAGVGIA